MTEPGRAGLHRERLWLAVAVLPPLALHLATLCRTAYGDFDSAEFATAVACWSVPHAPGYPLFLWFATVVASLLPAEPALGANLASTLAGAAGVGCLHLLVVRWTANPLAGVIAAWSLGASFTYWLMAVVAEVYVPQAAVELAAALALAHGSLTGFATAIGLGLANHPSTVLVAGPFALWIALEPGLLASARGRLKELACRLLAPGLLYLYLPLACHFSGHPGFWIRELGLDLAKPVDLWWYLSLKAYPSTLYRWELEYIGGELAYVAQCLIADFGMVPALLALAGLGWLARRRPAAGAAIVLAIAVQAGFYAAFTAQDKFTMFCPAFALAAVGIGVAAAWLLEQAGGGWRGVTAGALLLAMPLHLAWTNYPRADLSRYSASRDYAAAALTGVPQNGVVLAGWQAATVLDYFAVTGGRTIEVRHHGLALLAASRRLSTPLGDVRSSESVGEEIAGIARSGRPVFASFGTPELAAHVVRERSGLLYRLRPRPPPRFHAKRPAGWPASGARTGVAGAELLALDLSGGAARAGAILKMRYRWRLASPEVLDTPVRTRLRERATGREILLGHERRRYQHHRLGMLRRAGEVSEYLEETFDFTLGPSGSDTEIRPGGYDLDVALGDGAWRRAAPLDVLASVGEVRP